MLVVIPTLWVCGLCVYHGDAWIYGYFGWYVDLLTFFNSENLWKWHRRQYMLIGYIVVTRRFFNILIPNNSISLCHHNGTTKNYTSVTARGIVRVAPQMCLVRLISDTHPCVSLASQTHLQCSSQTQGHLITWHYLEGFMRAHRLGQEWEILK